MTKIMPIVIGALFWAWMTEASTRGKYGVHKQSSINYFPFFMLVLTLALPAALRRSFNDTSAYIKGFMLADPVGVLLQSGELHIQKEELNSAGWFTRDHLPILPDTCSIARQLVDDWLATPSE